MDHKNEEDLLKLTSNIVLAYIQKNNVKSKDIPHLINQVFASLTDVKKISKPLTKTSKTLLSQLKMQFKMIISFA